MASAPEDYFKQLPDEILQHIINTLCISASDNILDACRQVGTLKAVNKRFKEQSSAWASFSEVDSVYMSTTQFPKKDVSGAAQLVLVTHTSNGCMNILRKVLSEGRNTLRNLYWNHSDSLGEGQLDALCNLLSECPLLEVLHLTSFERLVGLKGMENLRVLKLEECHDLALGPAAFAGFEALENLIIRYCSAASDIVVESKSLKSLILDKNRNSKFKINLPLWKVCISAPNLESLTVRSGPTLAEVSGVKKVRRLSLHGLGGVIFQCSSKWKMDAMGVFYNWRQERNYVVNDLNVQAGSCKAGAHMQVHKLTESMGNVVHVQSDDDVIAVNLGNFGSFDSILCNDQGVHFSLSSPR